MPPTPGAACPPRTATSRACTPSAAGTETATGSATPAPSCPGTCAWPGRTRSSAALTSPRTAAARRSWSSTGCAPSSWAGSTSTCWRRPRRCGASPPPRCEAAAGAAAAPPPHPRRDSDDDGGSGSDEAALRRAEADALLERARRVICFKSAKYSVEHPLLVGAALGGAPQELSEAYSSYGLALGEAFQLRDDVLGVFGDPAQTGKPAGDDLREGKRTVLVACALGAASASQADLLHRHLGDPHLDADGVGALRRVMVDTGALARVEEMIEDGVRRAREALAGAPVAPQAREALEALVVAATARAA
ncbi:MAG: polyprenyl synthetase family protein [Quadrisphaera sp.]